MTFDTTLIPKLTPSFFSTEKEPIKEVTKPDAADDKEKEKERKEVKIEDSFKPKIYEDQAWYIQFLLFMAIKFCELFASVGFITYIIYHVRIGNVGARLWASTLRTISELKC